MGNIIALVGIVLLAGGVGTCIYAGWKLLTQFYQRLSRKYENYFDLLCLDDADPARMAIITLVTAVLGFLIGFRVVGWPMGVVLTVVGYFLPEIFYARQLYLHRKQARDQIPDGIRAICSSLKAGNQLPQAVRDASYNTPAPLNKELAKIRQKWELAGDLESCFEESARRLDSKEMGRVAHAVEVTLVMGGRITEVLEKIGDAVYEEGRLRRLIDNETSAARLNMRVMPVVPVIFLGIQYLIDPVGTGMLFTTLIGKTILIIAIVLNIVGFLIGRRVINIDI